MNFVITVIKHVCINVSKIFACYNLFNKSVTEASTNTPHEKSGKNPLEKTWTA